MKLVYLTRDKNKVEYIDENITIIEIVGDEVKTSQAIMTFSDGRYLVLDDTYEVKWDDVVTDEMREANLAKNFIVHKMTIEEELEAMKKERDKYEQKNKELKERIDNTEDTLLQMMNMISMLQKMNLPI